MYSIYITAQSRATGCLNIKKFDDLEDINFWKSKEFFNIWPDLGYIDLQMWIQLLIWKMLTMIRFDTVYTY